MSILTAVDGEMESGGTIELAHGLARELNEELVVLHVMSQDLFDKLRESGTEDLSTALSLFAPEAAYGIQERQVDGATSDTAYSIDQAEADAKHVARSVLDETVEDATDVRTIGRVGEPDAEIVAEATRRDVRYLVIGGRKRTPVGKVVFGSTTQSVLLDAEQPVLSIPRGASSPSTDGPVVAAIDRSNRAARVVEEAWKLADETGRNLHVVHALTRDEFESLGETQGTESSRAVAQQYVQEAGAEIAAEMAAEIADSFTPVGLVGEAPRQIVDYADEADASYVVTSGRKRSPIGKVLFGSVTQSIMLNSEKPVLAAMADE